MKPAMTVVLVAFYLFGNEPVFAQDTSETQSETVAEHRWVGFSTTMTDGAINADFGLLLGHSAMHKICADEVAPNARACFTSEVVRSVVDGRRETTGYGSYLRAMRSTLIPARLRVTAGSRKIPPLV